MQFKSSFLHFRRFNLQTSLILILLTLFVFVKATEEEDDDLKNASANYECTTKSKISSTLLVGLLSSVVFSFIGILPSFFIRTDKDEELFKHSMVFKFLISFAAGSLLGDVFLHLIPESFNGPAEHQIQNGLYAIFAFILFLLIEKLTGLIPDAHALGTLNLVANFFDNSAHGTTVVGAFEVSLTFGMIALIATIIHEVPHEFSDFALLLRDGYSRRKAIFFQLITAMAGTIGATISYLLAANSHQNKSCLNGIKYESNLLMDLNHHSHQNHHNQGSIVLPFTIGGFLYISLVGIVPEIVEETDKKISILQLFSFIFGVLFIYCLVQIEHIIPGYLV